ncbi:MFS transporter [Paenibacillus melissococcoides]|uniref:MFS transporter n=2 Tax=Paenibacillus TaxID=44249 RepID=A0ABN8U0E7_9BACL|nr:MFS transporter [Paenibacillus melissococcoides]CAH8244100.1 MFS transporter [Paenibacillus melissococcoides]CAH8706455.1 MFS transporter [Paenibacillus melissococcoides]
MNRRKMMAWTSVLQAALAAFLVLLLWLDALHLWQLYLFGFLLSAVSYTFGNAKHAIVPQLFPRERMTDIQARFTLLGTVLSIIGPSIVRFLFIWLAYEWLFFLYAISLLLLSVTVLLLDPVPSPQCAREQTIWQDMKKGMSELFGNKTLLPPTITILFTNLATSLVIGVLVFYTVDQLGATPKEVGWMFSISAFGGDCRSARTEAAAQQMDKRRHFPCHALHRCGCALLLFLRGDLVAARDSVSLPSMHDRYRQYHVFGDSQESTPNHLLGRVAGTSSMFMKLALPLGLLLSCLWADHLPIPWLFLIANAIVACLASYLSRSSFRTAK